MLRFETPLPSGSSEPISTGQVKAKKADLTLLVPPLPTLIGLQFSHAFLVTDNQTLQPRFASNPVPLLMVQ